MHFHGLQLGPALYRVASAPALQAGSSLGPFTGTSGLTLAPTCPAFSEKSKSPLPLLLLHTLPAKNRRRAPYSTVVLRGTVRIYPSPSPLARP